MCIGVATSNSILLITFANDQRLEGHDARSAALTAGGTRLRPVMMTALAMIIGMLPMSLGLGEGGEQNAPLGRAVIGGLLVATFFTLFFVPVMYSVLRRKPPIAGDRRRLRRGRNGGREAANEFSSTNGGRKMTSQPTVEGAPREQVRTPLPFAASPGSDTIRSWSGVRGLGIGALVATILAIALIARHDSSVASRASSHDGGRRPRRCPSSSHRIRR